MGNLNNDLPMPTILTVENLVIAELRPDYEAHDARPKTVVPFDLLWLEFTEEDGSSAPLPTGWDTWFFMVSGWPTPTRVAVAALRHAWTPRVPPPGGRWHAFIHRMLDDLVTSIARGGIYREPAPDRGIPPLSPAELAAKRSSLQDAHRARRERLREAREEGERQRNAISARKRAQRREQTATIAARMRELGVFVQRRRLPEERPAPIHVYNCGALSRAADATLFDGFDVLPEDARLCRTCHPESHEEVAA